MKIKVPYIFQDEIVEASLIASPSQMSRDSDVKVLEITGRYLQLQPPANNCILVSATPAEQAELKAAGYQLKNA